MTPHPDIRRRTIALVGLMGAGKTTVGRRLAQTLGLAFRDADHEIELAAGCSVADIFARHGEAEFRQGERRVIARLLEGPPHVLSTGGGAFAQDETRALIQSKAVSIWLKADLDVLVRRVGRKDTRPLLHGKDPHEVLQALMEARHPTYAMADITIETHDGPATQAIDMIVEALNARCGAKA